MPLFEFSALDRSGARIAGTLDAPSAADAAEQLVRRGLVPITTAPAQSTSASGDDKVRAPLGDDDLLTFSRQLATLLAATLPLDEALQLVAAQQRRTPVGKLATRVGSAVLAGRSLSEALTHNTTGLARFVPALIAAGEARGRLAPALDDLTRILERRRETRTRVRGAVLYPAILIVVALVVVAVVLGILVPTLLPLFVDARRPPPAILNLADGVVRFVIGAWPLLLALGLLVGLGVRALWQREQVRIRLDAALLKFPIMGSLSRDTNVAVISRTLGMLIANGVSLPDALTITSDVAPNRAFRASLAAIAAHVREGVPLTEAVARQPIYPDEVHRFIAIGERASRLDTMLLHLADASEREATRRLDTALTVLSPALTILIGIVIGGLILSVMQATLSINDLTVR